MSKYHNKRVQIDGMWFDSKKEGNHYLYLKDLQKKGIIHNLRMQVPFVLLSAVKGMTEHKRKQKDGSYKYFMAPGTIQQEVKYFADFVYEDRTGKEYVVDVKSKATAAKEAYKLKKKMMLALLGIGITEVIY